MCCRDDQGNVVVSSAALRVSALVRANGDGLGLTEAIDVSDTGTLFRSTNPSWRLSAPE